MNTVHLPVTVHTQDRIRILEIKLIGVGKAKDVSDKESVETLFPCRVRWCPECTDVHVVHLSEKELSFTETITILGFSPTHITPGMYKKIILPVNQIVFEQE